MTGHANWPAPHFARVGERLQDSRSRLGETRPRAAPGLLVSVRSPAEARLAFDAGADLLDVKEPARGALGRADWPVIAEIVRDTRARVAVSAALGELTAEDDLGGLPEGVAFAKLGLAGCGAWTNWPERWAAAMASLPAGVVRVAVAYADWRTCGAPSPDEVLAEGARLGCGAALLDTCDKSRGALFDHFPADEVGAWIDHVRGLGLRVVIAGSLTLETVGPAAALGPDYVAVRGAACRGCRSGELDPQRIAALRRRITRHGGPTHEGQPQPEGDRFL